MAKTAVVNLVDLAGSERVDSTGATGDRLKEVLNKPISYPLKVINCSAMNSR